MSKQRPILFSTPMVQAILEGRKTQTRRIVEYNISWESSCVPKGSLEGFAVYDKNGNMYWKIYENEPVSLADGFCRYGYPGDVLYVRETWQHAQCFDYNSVGYVYYANPGFPAFAKEYNIRWKPSIHMPKEAARIWLLIEDVRVERLQDITEEDAKAEGVIQNRDGSWHDYIEPNRLWQDDAKASFISLWESINGPESWKLNPWVWVLKFKKIDKP